MRLALAFAVVMAVVLAGVGAFLYIRLAHELDRSIDQNLRSRASDLAGVVQAADGGLGGAGTARLLESDESFAQVIARDGRVVDATEPTAEAPLLSPSEIARAARSTIFLERSTTPVGDEPVRLLATPVDARDGPVIVVVGASTGDRAEALNSLRRLLFIGGPIALVLASAAGYALAAAALRPVDAMRRRADTITSAGDAQRLPVPPARDELSDLARTLNAMLDRIDAAAERERRFVADASHELRRPVTSLKAELEVAVRRARSRDELHAALLSAVADADVLAHLADDLLLLASARDGGLPLRRAPLEVAELLEGVARRFALRAEAARRAIVLGPIEPVRVYVDRLRLEQALDNLVDNALRHGAGAVTLPLGGATPSSTSRSPTRAADSRTRSSSTPSSGSGAPTTRAPGRAPASDSRSSRRSPRRTAAPRRSGTWTAPAPSQRSRFRSPPRTTADHGAGRGRPSSTAHRRALSL